MEEFIKEHSARIHQVMSNYLQRLSIPDRLKESMLYSIEAGGKRMRPILVLASFKSYGEEIEKALSTAIALEMIHTYSLIHDDLPSMDNDDLRRGKPTNHIKFDEATAILAGDALLTYSFEIIAKDPLLTDTQKVKILQLLAESSGPKGMVAGQFLDMKAENKAITLEELEKIHTLKTGALLRFAVLSGAQIANASENQLKHLDEFVYYLGLVFQVQDDILDIIGDPNKLGKPTGSDVENEKSTYPALLGLEGAIAKKEEYIDWAIGALEKAEASNSYLLYFLDYVSQRDH